LAHLAGRMTENLVAILELHAEHGVRQQLDHLPAHLEEFFPGHSIPVCGKKLLLFSREGEIRKGGDAVAPAFPCSGNDQRPVAPAPCAASAASSSKATLLVILIIGFTAGPGVSLSGSPTAAPWT